MPLLLTAFSALSITAYSEKVRVVEYLIISQISAPSKSCYSLVCQDVNFHAFFHILISKQSVPSTVATSIVHSKLDMIVSTPSNSGLPCLR